MINKVGATTTKTKVSEGEKNTAVNMNPNPALSTCCHLANHMSLGENQQATMTGHCCLLKQWREEAATNTGGLESQKQTTSLISKW